MLWLACLSSFLSLAATTVSNPVPVSESHFHDGLEQPPGSKAIAQLSFNAALAGVHDNSGLRVLEQAVSEQGHAARNLPRMAYNPRVNVQPGFRTLPSDRRQASIQASLVQPWVLGNLASARRDSARSEVQASRANLDARILEQRLDTAEIWLHLRGTEIQLRLAREELQVASELESHITRGVEAGVRTAVDEAEVGGYLAQVDAEVIDLQGRVHDLGLQLARASGNDPSQPLGTKGELPSLNLPNANELTQTQLLVEHLPQLRERRLDSVAARANELETRRATSPILSTGIAVEHENTGELYVYGVVGIEIPIWNRGKRERGKARVDTQRTEAQSLTEERKLKAMMAHAVHEIEHTRLVVERLEQRSIPALQTLVQARERSLALGEGTLFEVLAARRRLIDGQQRLAGTQAEQGWAETKLWLLLESAQPETVSEAGGPS